MKVTKHVIGKNGCFSRELLSSQFMSAAGVIKRTGKEIKSNFKGFGVAITGSSCYELMLMDPNERAKLLNHVYSTDGLNLSVGRLTVGSSDYSPDLYSYDDVPFDTELKHFSIERDKKHIIPIVKEILKIRPDIFLFSSPWSPPGWMKTGGSMFGGYMRDEFVECYAEYYVKYLKAYKDEGIIIRALTPQNECETSQDGRSPACIWHPDTEAKFIKILKQKLIENGLDVEIWMYDHNFNGVPRILWMLDNYKGLYEATDAIAFHYYQGEIENTVEVIKKYPNLELNFTEAGPGLFENYDGDYCKWATVMLKVLNCGYSSFCGWNLMLDERGNPNIGPFFCGGLITLNSETKELSYSGQYKAFEKISHFMKNGSKVLETVWHEDGVNMMPYENVMRFVTAAAFETPKGDIGYVLVNPDKDRKRQVEIYENDEYYYIELLPDTVTTVMFEK